MLLAVVRNKQVQGVLAVFAAVLIVSNLERVFDWVSAILVRAVRLAEEQAPQIVQNLFDGLG